MKKILVVYLAVLVVYANSGVKGNDAESSYSRCSDGFGLNYTLPMFTECPVENINGSMVQTIPKLIPAFPAEDARCSPKGRAGFRSGHAVCRVPDCLRNPCGDDFCKETLTGYFCYSQIEHYMPNGNDTTRTTELANLTPTPGQTTALVNNEVVTCPGQWVAGFNKCYLIPFIRSQMFKDAKAFCENISPVYVGKVARFPSLLLPESAEETRVFTRLARAKVAEVSWFMTFWINCVNVNGSYSCIKDREGNEVQYRNWDQGEPNNPGIKDCALLVNLFLENALKSIWNSMSCTKNVAVMRGFYLSHPPWWACQIHVQGVVSQEDGK